MRIAIPRNADFSKQVKRTKAWSGDSSPCQICGRRIKEGGGIPVHVDLGDEFVTEDEPMNPASDMGTWYIGADCLRKHPELKPFLGVAVVRP